MAGFEEVFEFETHIEVVFDGALAAPGDDNDVLDAGVLRFLDAVLDQGLIDERQHLLRHRLGCRKESCSEPGRGENRFTNFLGHSASILSARVKRFGRPTLTSSRWPSVPREFCRAGGPLRRDRRQTDRAARACACRARLEPEPLRVWLAFRETCGRPQW